MKRLVLSVRSQDRERIDEIAFLEGDVLMRNQGKNSPLVAISDVVGARLEDDAPAARARTERPRLTSYFPDDPRGHLLRLPPKGPDDV